MCMNSHFLKILLKVRDTFEWEPNDLFFLWNSSEVLCAVSPESACSEVGVAVGVTISDAVGVPVVSAWLLWSESGEEVRGEEEGAELSTDDELDGGGAVTVDDDPEEEEEVDLGRGAAAAGPADTSGVSVSAGLVVVLGSWLESPAEAGWEFDAPSGRTAVPVKPTGGNNEVPNSTQHV